MDTEKIGHPIKWTHILRWYIIDISDKVYKIDEDFFSRTNYGGLRMAKFTWEQIEKLRQSPYVRKINTITVSFTGDFKRRFWAMHTEGNLMPREILELLGIDTEILGGARIRSIAYNLKQEYATFGEFSDIRRNGRSVQDEILPPVQEINKLRMEVEYLRQEQEFIKKIISSARGIKSE